MITISAAAQGVNGYSGSWPVISQKPAFICVKQQRIPADEKRVPADGIRIGIAANISSPLEAGPR